MTPSVAVSHALDELGRALDDFAEFSAKYPDERWEGVVRDAVGHIERRLDVERAAREAWIDRRKNLVRGVS